MAKFKLAARTVMLASEKATDEKAKKKVISVDISANSAEAFDADIQHWNDYDYILINQNLENCYQQIEKIISVHKSSFSEFPHKV